MKHYFYIIYSEKTDKYYYGSSHNPDIRLRLHNDGTTPSTKGGIPWRLVHSEEYKSKLEALKRESEIKRRKNRRYIEDLIKDVGN